MAELSKQQPDLEAQEAPSAEQLQRKAVESYNARPLTSAEQERSIYTLLPAAVVESLGPEQTAVVLNALQNERRRRVALERALQQAENDVADVQRPLAKYETLFKELVRAYYAGQLSIDNLPRKVASEFLGLGEPLWLNEVASQLVNNGEELPTGVLPARTDLEVQRQKLSLVAAGELQRQGLKYLRTTLSQEHHVVRLRIVLEASSGQQLDRVGLYRALKLHLRKDLQLVVDADIHLIVSLSDD